MPEEILEEARALIDNLNWVEAKTYRHTAPHEYAGNYNNKDRLPLLVRLEHLVREYGVTEYFYGNPEQYLHIDGLKYFGKYQEKGWWGINRAKADIYYGEQPKEVL